MSIKTSTYPSISLESIKIINNTLSKQVLLSKSFLATKQSTIFLTEKTKITLSQSLKAKAKTNGFLLEILFNGLNYSNKRIKLSRPHYFCDVHRSEVFICNEAVANHYKSRIYKRRLIFFSYNLDLLNKIELLIKSFRRPNIYTAKGLYSPKDVYRVKKMKKRK